MPTERAILCGDVPINRLPCVDDKYLWFHLWGQKENVKLEIADVREHLLRDVPSLIHDLLEIATYVYCADQAIPRGSDNAASFGTDWRRRLFFRIAVREPDHWNDSKIKNQLCETLGFLSEDEYNFEFCKLTQMQPEQKLIPYELPEIDEVMMFSGGIDSLGGAVQEAVIDERKVALVSHRPTQKMHKRLEQLIELLNERSHFKPHHISVTIFKSSILTKEYTQRSRSFLYAALGTTIARMIGLKRLRFYENGVISFNLPPSPQVVGARATRTTHPQVINGFSKIISAVSGTEFVVENPFIWKTKPEVLKIIENADCCELINNSTSCNHTWEMSNQTPHCGKCSQCIDRRFSILSAGLEKYDNAEGYGIDLLTGNREEALTRTMLAAYVDSATAVSKMTSNEFFIKYGEASRILRHFNESPDTVAAKLYDLYRRHAVEVTRVVDTAIKNYASSFREHNLPEHCLLTMVCDYSRRLSNSSEANTSSYQSITDGHKNVFIQQGKGWLVRFNGGKEFVIPPSIGAAYLHTLLSHPNQEFKVNDLVRLESKQPEMFILKRGFDVIDDSTVLACQAKIKELQVDLKDATDAECKGEPTLRSVAEINEEIRTYFEYLKRSKDIRYHTRKLHDDSDKVRKAFIAAIRRVKMDLAKFDINLSEHLKSPRLTCGRYPSYNPGQNIEWFT